VNSKKYSGRHVSRHIGLVFFLNIHKMGAFNQERAHAKNIHKNGRQGGDGAV
jgi:hypothetical protein